MNIQTALFLEQSKVLEDWSEQIMVLKVGDKEPMLGKYEYARLLMPGAWCAR